MYIFGKTPFKDLNSATPVLIFFSLKYPKGVKIGPMFKTVYLYRNSTKLFRIFFLETPDFLSHFKGYTLLQNPQVLPTEQNIRNNVEQENVIHLQVI